MGRGKRETRCRRGLVWHPITLIWAQKSPNLSVNEPEMEGSRDNWASQCKLNKVKNSAWCICLFCAPCTGSLALMFGQGVGVRG
jgi:hypothetical protein